jgi:hypothetical protein
MKHQESNLISNKKSNNSTKLLSKKCINKIESPQFESIIAPDESENDKTLICEYCLAEFTRKYNFTRHIKRCPSYISKIEKDMENIQINMRIAKLEEDNKILKQENKKLEQKTIKLEQENKKLQEKIEKDLRDENKYKIELVQSAGSVANNAINKLSALSYANKYYNDAPVLTKMDSNLLVDAKTSNDFIKNILHYHKKNQLPNYLGDELTKKYKTENPSEQSIWNTDTVRNSYIIRTMSADKSIWATDKKGKNTEKIAIVPFINTMNSKLKIYSNKLRKEMKENERIDNENKLKQAERKKLTEQLNAGEYNAKTNDYSIFDKKEILFDERYLERKRIEVLGEEETIASVLTYSKLAEDIVKYISPTLFLDRVEIVKTKLIK